ncbi:MAG: hypothetical protein ACPG8W_01640 [Candidatus Promineifilaceae bacterium]
MNTNQPETDIEIVYIAFPPDFPMLATFPTTVRRSINDYEKIDQYLARLHSRNDGAAETVT